MFFLMEIFSKSGVYSPALLDMGGVLKVRTLSFIKSLSS